MAFVIKDRIKEGTTTTGTGAVSLGGASATFEPFSSYMTNGDTTYYAIVHTASGVDEWEVGLGTWNTGNTLTRTTVIAGTNDGSPVDFSAGTKDIFMTYPASVAAYTDASGDLSGDIGLGNHSTTELVEGSNLYYTDARVDAHLSGGTGVTYNAGAISIGQDVATTADVTFNTVTLAGDPTTALEAATKEYVDTIAAAGIHYHDPVRVEAPSNLTATYDNGTSGVGATLTNSGTQAAITIDGVALSVADRVLVYNQTNPAHNGIYTVTTVGSGSTNWVLTRATDADSYGVSDKDALGEGDAYFVKEGDTGAGELYVMNTPGVITFGTTPISFTIIAETAIYSAGTGLTLTGTVFATEQDIATTASPTFNTVTADLVGDTAGTHTGAVVGNVTGDLTGNADTATALETSRTIQLTGDVIGSATFNGTANAVITATVQDDSHAHVISNVDGLQSALDAKADDSTTITAGSGLTGGGSIGVNRTISHADTSTQASLTALTGAAVVSDVDVDTYGHVTGLATRNMTLADLGFTGETDATADQTITAGSGLSGGGTGNVTLSHSDTSTQASVNNSGATVIQDVTLDTYGHVTGLASTALTPATIGAATSAQGALADSATQPGDNISTLTNDAGFTTNVGDITGVTAGSGISGGGTSGTVTVSHADTSTQASVNNSGRTYIQDITLDGFGHITGITSATETVVDTNTNQLTTFQVEDGDGNEVTISHGKEWKFTEAGGININWTDTDSGSDADPYDLSFNVSSSITAGDGLTGGGVLSSSRTLNVGAGGGITVSADAVSHADTSSQGSVNNSGATFIQDVTVDTYGHVTGLGSTTISPATIGAATSAQGALADSALQSGDNISALTNDAGYTTNVGDITNVSAGTGLSGGGASGSVTLSVDLSELTDMTAAMIGTDEFIVLDAGADRRKAANEIGLSIFSNDAGFTTNVGDITGVTAGSGISGGGTSGTVTISHADTSSQASVNNSGRTYIQDITLDTYGHITGITSATETVVNTDTTYSAGDGLDLTGTTFSVTDAPKWTTARTLTLSGDVSGSTSWDGSGNASISVTVADDSHNHTIANVDGLQTALDGKLSTSGKAADSNLLDGIDSSAFLRSNTADTFTTLSGTQLNLGSQVQLAESSDRADLLQITSITSVWAGLQIRNSLNEGRWSFMTDGESAGIYNDEDSQWHIYMTEGQGVELRHAAATKLATTSTGILVSGDLNSTSDIRLKDDIKPIENALSDVCKLEGVSFNWKDTGTKATGFIAQQVEPILPDLVSTSEDDGIKSVNYIGLIGHLVEAIKEQQVQIDELKAKLNS